MAPFNIAWNRLGSVEAATRVRESIEYLPYTNDDSSIDDEEVRRNGIPRVRSRHQVRSRPQAAAP